MSAINPAGFAAMAFGAAPTGDRVVAAPLAQMPARGNGLQLALGTLGFAVCFAAFGALSAMMPEVRKTFHLTETQKWMAIAIPVLLGSLGRIPLGVLTDRLGGRTMFILTLICSIIPVFLLGCVTTFPLLLLCGFFVGIGLASFSVGVGFVSPWFPANRQGTALGIYGLGNIGQAAAAFGSPVIAAAITTRWGDSAGYRWGFWVWGRRAGCLPSLGQRRTAPRTAQELG
jgi:NNP family nitrate/nitrite transporter-like MFS transporter